MVPDGQEYGDVFVEWFWLRVTQETAVQIVGQGLDYG